MNITITIAIIILIVIPLMIYLVSNGKVGNFFDTLKGDFKFLYVLFMGVLLIVQILVLYFYGYELADKWNLILTTYFKSREIAVVVSISILILYFLFVMCFYIIENKVEGNYNAEDKWLSLIDLLSAFSFNIFIILLYGKLIVEVNEGRKALMIFLTIIMAVLVSSFIPIFIERVFSVIKTETETKTETKTKRIFLLTLILVIVTFMFVYIYLNFNCFSLLESGSLLFGAILSTLLTLYFKCNEIKPNKGELNKNDN